MNSFLKIWLAIGLVVLGLTTGIGQNPLSKESTISILTCDPGSELYSTFGHTAIRVKDDAQKMDIIFNYGIFDFSTPGFYTKFLRGKLNYKLGVTNFSSFMREYQFDKRSVTEQVLDLDSLRKQSVFDFIRNNALPENRDYKYDFFFDNCSTRTRDVYQNVLGLEMSKEGTSKTFRDLLDEFLPGLVWSDFGIDLVIGAIADDQVSQFHQTFLPDYFMHATDELSNNSKSFVKDKKLILDYRKEREKRFEVPFFTPAKLFYGLLFIECLICFFFWNKSSMPIRMYDHVWCVVFGLAGLLLLFMWFGTDHLATKENWNLLWLNPLFLIIPFLKQSKAKTYLTYFLIVLLTTCLLFWTVIPQQFHLAFIPIILIMLLKLIRAIKNDFVQG